VQRLIFIAAALPAIVLATLSAVSGAGIVLSGQPMIFAARAENLAEAAANQDAAEVVLRLALGEDVNRPAHVRIPRQFEKPWLLTPLEAAVVGQKPSIVKLVIERGARVDSATLLRVRCFAQHRGGHGRVGDEDTIAYLTTLGSAAIDCDGVPIPVED
jgi:hypothetical protein